MKKLYLLIFASLNFLNTNAQQNYCDFEGNKVLNFEYSTGTLDTAMVSNPGPSPVDMSLFCGKYTRDTALFDNIKLTLYSKLIDVSPYANISATLKIRMKIFTSAPPGTMIHLQLGQKSNNNYPAGVHSEYTAVTSAQFAWDVVTFNYFQSPVGSMVSPTSIDKIILLFHPNSHGTETYYFDDLTGPSLAIVGVPSYETPLFKLSQNYPNPVKENTHIKLQLNSAGPVSLKVYDMLGNSVLSLLDQTMNPGAYSIPVEIENMPNGIYFYELKKDGASQTMKLVISR